MQTAVVVLDKWPIDNVDDAARACAAVLGGVYLDHANKLRQCRGIVADQLPPEQGKRLAGALRKAGCGARALSDDLVPRLPKANTARRLDPRDDDNLLAQVQMSGLPEIIPWQRVALIVPTIWHDVEQTKGGAPKKKASIIATARSMAPTSMVRSALKGPRSERAGTMTQARMAKRLVLDIIAVQPLERLRAHADRLDYSVLEHTQMNSKANWKSLVAALQHKAGDNLVGGQILQQYLRKDELPDWLNVDGAADLSRSLRWLMLCEVSERMAASGGASSPGDRSTSAMPKSARQTEKKNEEGEMSQGGGLFERYGRIFEAGERLFSEGDTSKEMYVLQQGKVRISRLRDGQQRSLVVLGDGEFFGEMAVLNGDPRSATATVETRSRMLVLEPEAFAALVRNKPDVAVRMIKKLTGRLRIANEHIQQLLVLDPNERVATYLLKMAKTEGMEREDGVSIRVVANDVVANVGLDLLRVESVLKNMEKAKVIKRFEGGIKLRSVQLLERYVAHIKKAGRSR